MNDVVVILLRNLVQVVGHFDHCQGIKVHLSENFIFERSSGIWAIAIDTKSESHRVQDGVDGVKLGLSDGGENSSETTEGSSDRSEERSDKLGDDDGSEHGDEQGEELGDLAKVDSAVNSILNGVVGRGIIASGGGGIVCGSIICGGGIVALGSAIAGWGVIGGGGIVILGGAIAGGGGGIPSVGGGSIASGRGGGGGSMVSMVMTSAISEDGSDEGEGSDVSGHGDLGLWCVNVFLLLRLGLNYALIRTLP